jgi:hypothetical protein
MAAEVEECRQRLKEAQEREFTAIDAATKAIREVIRARRLTLYAWIDLATARGSTDTFKRTYEETALLQYREDHRCEAFVRKSIDTGFWARLNIF